MSKKSSSSSVTEFLTGLLTISFVVLKITEYIDWSWWWVLSPIWISIVAGLGIILMGYLYYYIMYRLKLRKFRKELSKIKSEQYGGTSTPDLSFDNLEVLNNLSDVSRKFTLTDVTIKISDNTKEDSNKPSNN